MKAPPGKYASKPRKSRNRKKPPGPMAAPIPEGFVSAKELARRAGVALQTVLRARKDGRLTRGHYVNDSVGWVYPADDVVILSKLGPRTNRLVQAEYEGTRDARILRGFEQGSSLSEVVISAEAPFAVVEDLFNRWKRVRALEARDREMKCACGGAIDARSGVCANCLPRTRTLTTAQLALLAGQPQVRETCRCTACAKTLPVDDARHFCLSHPASVTVGTDGALDVYIGGEHVTHIVGTLETATELARVHGLLPKETPAAPIAESQPYRAPPGPPEAARMSNQIKLKSVLKKFGLTDASGSVTAEDEPAPLELPSISSVPGFSDLAAALNRNPKKT